MLPSTRAAELTLTPGICVVDATRLCTTQVQLTYQSREAVAVCLESNDPVIHICRDAAKEHDFAIHISTARDVQFHIKDPKQKIVASQILRLANYMPNKERRRRAFSWSF